MPSNEKPQNYDTNSKEVSKPKLQDEESSNESKSELNACNSEPTPEENTIKTENNETPNITTYITLAFLIASAGIAIYLSIKIIISKKKI